MHNTHPQWPLSLSRGLFHNISLYIKTLCKDVYLSISFCYIHWHLSSCDTRNGNIKRYSDIHYRTQNYSFHRRFVITPSRPSLIPARMLHGYKILHKTLQLLCKLVKSTIILLGMNERDVAALASPCHLPRGNIKYLGFNISSKLSELFHLYFTPSLKWLKLLNQPTISFSGRTAMIKITTLPKIIYLFTTIRTFPKTPWPKSLKSATSKNSLEK